MQPRSFIFMGRSGSGKGTQADLLLKALKDKTGQDALYIQSGGELRELASHESPTGKIVSGILLQGGLMPSFIPIYIWTKVMKDRFTGKEHLVFDGSPRKIMEAHALDDVFPFYGLEKPWVIYLDVGHEESTQRLTKRGRNDDTPHSIKSRHSWYDTDVAPIVEYYRKSPKCRFLDIHGERTIEEIHADIMKKIGL